jgi:hypothetical protein
VDSEYCVKLLLSVAEQQYNHILFLMHISYGEPLSKVQDGDPGEIQARSQAENQLDAKQGAKKKKQNGEKSETAK